MRAWFAATAVLALLALPASAQASSVENVEISTYRCLPSCEAAPATAGLSMRMLVSFEVTSGLEGGDKITLKLSTLESSWGQFLESGATSDAQYWLNTPNGNFNVSGSEQRPAFSLDRREVVLTAPTTTVEAGQQVTVQAGHSSPLVMMPTKAGTYSLSVSTSRDSDPVETQFQVVPGTPQLIRKLNDDLSTVRGREFPEPPQVRVEDGNFNPIPNALVTFTAPNQETSGFFPGDMRSYTTSTDEDGVATATDLRASAGLGSWQLVPSVDTGFGILTGAAFELENLRPPPETLELELQPAEIVGDGLQTSRAVITLIDDEGGPVANESVAVSVDGGPPQAATDLGDGSYEYEIPPRTQPGELQVVASYDGVDPPLTDTQTLTVHADVQAPSVRITKKPKRKLKRKRAAFRFRSNAPDLAGFECKLDRRPWRSCKSPKAYRVSRGRHAFRVRAVDLAGNRGKPAVKRFKRVKRAKRR